MAQIKVEKALPMKVEKGQKVTIYKNTTNIYVAIVAGMEIGVAYECNCDKENIKFPSCMEGIVEEDSTTNNFTVLVQL